MRCNKILFWIRCNILSFYPSTSLCFELWGVNWTNKLPQGISGCRVYQSFASLFLLSSNLQLSDALIGFLYPLTCTKMHPVQLSCNQQMLICPPTHFLTWKLSGNLQLGNSCTGSKKQLCNCVSVDPSHQLFREMQLATHQNIPNSSIICIVLFFWTEQCDQESGANESSILGVGFENAFFVVFERWSVCVYFFVADACTCFSDFTQHCFQSPQGYGNTFHDGRWVHSIVSWFSIPNMANPLHPKNETHLLQVQPEQLFGGQNLAEVNLPSRLLTK